MANVPISNMTATWTDSGTTYTAIKMNVTDTASNAASLLLDLQTSGTSSFRITKGDPVLIGAGNSGRISYSSLAGAITFGTASNALRCGYVNTSAGLAERLSLASDLPIGFTATTSALGAIDTILTRDAANTLAQRNATNPQAFNIYNTYTNASNYERSAFSWSSNVLRIATENAGTGSSRSIQLYPSSGNVDIIDGSSVAQISFNIQSSNGLRVASDRPIGFTPGGANLAAPDTTLRRVAAGILGVRGGLITDPGALAFIEQTAPAAPATNGVYIYAQDNGAGKTQLMARFATGAAVQIAIEP